jgi:hypothetical protein
MPAIAMVLIGFLAGLLTMTIVNLYRWVLELFMNEGFK